MHLRLDDGNDRAFSLFTAGQRLTAHIKESAEDLVPQRMKVIRRSEY